jgi:RND family efflux transporter MFP subunit
MKIIGRSTLPWILVLFLAAALGIVLARRSPPATGHAAAAAGSATPDARKVLYWVDPMVPGYKSDKPGKSPFMDMELVPVYEDGGAVPAGTPGSPGVPGYAGIAVSPERQQAIGVRLGKTELRELEQTIRTVGRVALDETLHYEVRPKFEGYVEELFVDYTGKPVSKGQPLLSIYSPELLATQQEYLLALRARERLGASANPEVAKGAAELYDSARQRLLLWDIRPADVERLEKTGEPRKALTLHSPVDGFVMSKNAVRGGRVMPSDTLFDIAGLSRVWILADLYESEAAKVRLGDMAKISLSYEPGRTWTGRVAFIAPMVDEATRTINVRIELANPDQALKPGMFADVFLERPLGKVLAVPDGAVMTTGTRSIVFVAKGDGRFEPREITAGARVGGWIEVRSGLAPGEPVVTQANFLVDSESRLKAALEGMVPATPPPGAPPPATPPPGHVH